MTSPDLYRWERFHRGARHYLEVTCQLPKQDGMIDKDTLLQSMQKEWCNLSGRNESIQKVSLPVYSVCLLHCVQTIDKVSALSGCRVMMNIDPIVFTCPILSYIAFFVTTVRMRSSTIIPFVPFWPVLLPLLALLISRISSSSVTLIPVMPILCFLSSRGTVSVSVVSISRVIPTNPLICPIAPVIPIIIPIYMSTWVSAIWLRPMMVLPVGSSFIIIPMSVSNLSTPTLIQSHTVLSRRLICSAQPLQVPTGLSDWLQ